MSKHPRVVTVVRSNCPGACPWAVHEESAEWQQCSECGIERAKPEGSAT